MFSIWEESLSIVSKIFLYIQLRVSQARETFELLPVEKEEPTGLQKNRVGVERERTFLSKDTLKLVQLHLIQVNLWGTWSWAKSPSSVYLFTCEYPIISLEGLISLKWKRFLFLAYFVIHPYNLDIWGWGFPYMISNVVLTLRIQKLRVLCQWPVPRPQRSHVERGGGQMLLTRQALFSTSYFLRWR